MRARFFRSVNTSRTEQTTPRVEQIEHYDEESQLFYSDKNIICKKIQSINKDAVVLIFAEFDYYPDSKDHGAMQYFYSNNYHVRAFYKNLSRHFILLRVSVNNSQQIESALRKIKSFLSPEQEIQHLMINAHANEMIMRLGYGGRYALLSGNDSQNFYAVTSSFSFLAKNATISLAGCLTAKGAKNIARDLSTHEIAKGRIIFGAPSIIGGSDTVRPIHYNVISLGGKSVLLPFFNADSPSHHVAAYKDGEEIAYGEWPAKQLRSRL